MLYPIPIPVNLFRSKSNLLAVSQPMLAELTKFASKLLLFTRWNNKFSNLFLDLFSRQFLGFCVRPQQHGLTFVYLFGFMFCLVPFLFIVFHSFFAFPPFAWNHEWMNDWPGKRHEYSWAMPPNRTRITTGTGPCQSNNITGNRSKNKRAVVSARTTTYS